MSRTMLTEVRAPNPKAERLPGMYAEVTPTLPIPHRVLSPPPRIGSAATRPAGRPEAATFV